MEFIYTRRTSGFEAGKQYRHPRFFERPDHRATSVVIEGDYPHIRDAYEAADVPVSGEKAKAATKASTEPEIAADSERDALAAEYEERFGKKPGRMNTETIREKLEAADEDGDQ